METIRNNDAIELIHDGKKIETYKLDEAIDFKALVEFLLKDELSTNFSFKDSVANPTIAEKEMISLLKEIIDKYNAKKSNFEQFLSAKQNVKTSTDN